MWKLTYELNRDRMIKTGTSDEAAPRISAAARRACSVGARKGIVRNAIFYVRTMSRSLLKHDTRAVVPINPDPPLSRSSARYIPWHRTGYQGALEDVAQWWDRRPTARTRACGPETPLCKPLRRGGSSWRTSSRRAGGPRPTARSRPWGRPSRAGGRGRRGRGR